VVSVSDDPNVPLVDQRRTIVFHVTRVWKGDVNTTFEMPAVAEMDDCQGFWPAYLKISPGQGGRNKSSISPGLRTAWTLRSQESTCFRPF
jgi:hypothetical protein